ncbi:flagellar hook-basal body complex protein FliE [Sutcliffiella horikoshii]|uniref:Flagellar hook-basal body complex protein FliE n=2 Tax=Sutcliffiella horikoshii TaxID=79883 RepID=A0A5D4T4H5_9BACI|nr:MULTISPECIES: flagellar hook-basal body complex protein FliE [Bacillaceae]MEA3320103.1 flagellar hook-basal body complex protein FliE [Bacillota bacterium]NLP50565.1 flagellar hook-basal body complex protein FliE [Bacillus sp. RO1]TYS70600.1 flagellar hook-basal body complex protein FliE [Sutcliffiella horikoshii]UAL49162.1 flagellar hook-basal body complex protein FliE [Sutcliffiella horikoshii]
MITKIANSNQMFQNLNSVQKTSGDVHQQFSTYLKDALNEVNNAQVASNQITTKLVNNEGVELHDVLIAQQKASVAMSLTMEVRNKGVEAYQEIMRMQV